MTTSYPDDSEESSNQFNGTSNLKTAGQEDIGVALSYDQGSDVCLTIQTFVDTNTVATVQMVL